MIEILLLFGIVFVSIGIVVWLAMRWMESAGADTAKWAEAFQGVAKGGAAPVYRGDYDRPRYVKATVAQNPYAQLRYTQAIENITSPQIRYIRIEGGGDYLTLSYIAVYKNDGTELSRSSSVSSSGEYDHCRHDWKFGKHWNWGPPWDAHYDPDWGCDLAGNWYVKDGDIRNKDFPYCYHSSGGSAWMEMTLDQAYWLDRVVIYNRRDNDTHRLAAYKLRLYDNNRKLVLEKNLTAEQSQSYWTDGYTCRAGYRHVGGRDTNCIQNCAAGETADNNARTCYKPCKAGEYLDGGTGGTCKLNRPAGYTLSGTTYYKDCVSPDVELDTANCYQPCKAGEDDTRRPKCYKVCPSGYRLIEDQCFPNDPATYLPIAWQGQVISQVDTTQNVGLCLPFPDKKTGVKAGFWGPISSPATDTSSDQIWAYTENMELVNMNNRKCLDTSSLTNTPLMWDCNNGITQKWFIDSENRIRSKQYPDRCLTTDVANGYTTAAIKKDADPVVRLNTSGGMAIDLQLCTSDGNKFQRWRLPGPRVGLQGVATTASAPPALPEPINRDGFIGTQAEPINRDGFIGTQAEPINRDGFIGTQAEEPINNTEEAAPVNTPLAERTTDDAF